MQQSCDPATAPRGHEQRNVVIAIEQDFRVTSGGDKKQNRAKMHPKSMRICLKTSKEGMLGGAEMAVLEAL